jgi:hypothetical protein
VPPPAVSSGGRSARKYYLCAPVARPWVLLRPEKAFEWLAGMSAVRAYLAKAGTEHRNALEQTKKFLTFQARLFNADRHLLRKIVAQNGQILP